MLAVETKELPEKLELSAFAAFEWARRKPVERRIHIRRTAKMWTVVDDYNRTILVAGIIQPALTDIPELWILLCEPFRKAMRRHLDFIKEEFRKVLKEFREVMIRVDAEAPLGGKFARMFGFEPYYETSVDGRDYVYFKVKHGIRSTRRA